MMSSTYSKSETIFNGKPCIPRMINNICASKGRNKFIENLIDDEYKIGRKILILNDRRSFLDDLLSKLNTKYNKDTAGLYVGGMKPHELRISKDDIILGTFSMASEGMDIPKLNTIVLASPKSDVVQSVGRILRKSRC